MRLALRPVAKVVGADHPEGAAHPDARAEPDQHPLKPQRAFEAAVDQPAVEADRMAEEQSGTRGQEEHCKGGRRDGEWTEDQRRREHRPVPQRMDRIPPHPARRGIGISGAEGVHGVRIFQDGHVETPEAIKSSLNRLFDGLASGKATA